MVLFFEFWVLKDNGRVFMAQMEDLKPYLNLTFEQKTVTKNDKRGLDKK